MLSTILSFVLGAIIGFGFILLFQSSLNLYALRHCMKVQEKAGEFLDNKWKDWFAKTGKDLYPLSIVEGRASLEQSNAFIDTVWPDCPGNTRKWANKYHCLSYRHPYSWACLDPSKDR